MCVCCDIYGRDVVHVVMFKVMIIYNSHIDPKKVKESYCKNMFWNPQRREVVGISRLIFHLNCASTVVLTVLMGNDGRCESIINRAHATSCWNVHYPRQ